MDVPYRVEPSTRSAYKPEHYDIVTARDGILCSTPDIVFAHRLVDLLNADEARLADIRHSILSSDGYHDSPDRGAQTYPPGSQR
jgi:hypothetical protein